MSPRAATLFLTAILGCGGAPSSRIAGPPPPAVPAVPAAPAEDPPAAPDTLAVPGPAASPCTNDSMCINHRCNLQYGKCAFPCVSDADCVRGTKCFKAVISTCQPTPPGE